MIGFRWSIEEETIRGIEEREPYEHTFETYEECKSHAEREYPEYKNIIISVCEEDEDGCVTVLAVLRLDKEEDM